MHANFAGQIFVKEEKPPSPQWSLAGLWHELWGFTGNLQCFNNWKGFVQNYGYGVLLRQTVWINVHVQALCAEKSTECAIQEWMEFTIVAWISFYSCQERWNLVWQTSLSNKAPSYWAGIEWDSGQYRCANSFFFLIAHSMDFFSSQKKLAFLRWFNVFVLEDSRRIVPQANPQSSATNNVLPIHAPNMILPSSTTNPQTT